MLLYERKKKPSNSHILFERNLEQINSGKRDIYRNEKKRRKNEKLYK